MIVHKGTKRSCCFLEANVYTKLLVQQSTCKKNKKANVGQ